MRSWLLQSTIDLSGGESIAPAQMAVAAGLLVAIAVLLLASAYRMQFAGLAPDAKRQKKTLLGQKEDQQPIEIVLESADDVRTRRDEIRAALVDRDPPSVDRTTLRQGLYIAAEDLASTWGSYAGWLPRLARYLGELAVALAVLAALVHIPTDTYERLFTTGGGSLSVDVVVANGLWAVDQFVGLVGGVLRTFPFLGSLWSLAFAYSVLLGQWIYSNPIPIIVILVGAAAAITWLDRRAPEAPRVHATDRRSAAIATVLVVADVWLAGAIPAAVFGVVGYETVGAMVGLGAALVVLVIQLVRKSRLALRSIRYSVALLEDPDREALAYIVTRRVGGLAATIAAPLIVLYAGAVVVTGKLGGVIGAYLSGTPSVQVTIAAFGLAILAGVAWAVRESWSDIRAGLATLRSRTAVRVVLFKRGVPIAVMTVTYLLAVGFTLPWVVGVVAALVAGIVARGLYVLVRRARYRAASYDPPERTPSQVVVRVYHLETAGGDRRYYAAVNDYDVAHEDPDMLTDAICRAANEIFADGSAEPAVERRFATDLLRFGIVDIAATRSKLEKDAERLGNAELAKRDGVVDDETLDKRATKELPRHIWESVREEMRNRGEWQYRNGYYIRTERHE